MSDDGPEPREEEDEAASGRPSAPPVRPWWSRSWLWWQAGILVVVVLALVGLDRAQKHVAQPQFCGSCHTTDVHELQASVHKSLECKACHEDRVGQNLHQWALGLISKTRITPHGKVDPGRCRSCHTRGEKNPSDIATTNGHLVHVFEAGKPLACSSCHKWKDHRTTPQSEACAGCHKKVHTFGGHAKAFHGKPVSCLSCHNYLARVEGGAQTPARSCQRCHGSANQPKTASRFAQFVKADPIQSTMIHGNLQTCAVCHQPHDKARDKRFRGQDCTLCHAKVTTEFHDTKMPDRFSCTTCHKPHGPRSSLITACTRCHKDKMDHGMLASQHSRCSKCHEAHSFQASVSGCRDCHADKALVLASWNAKAHNDCENCHKPHEAKAPQTFCASCHRNKRHQPHPACTTCHDPHQDTEHVKKCSGCHKAKLAQLKSSAPRHRAGCRTCHAPHAPLDAPKSCKVCHSDKVQLVATAGPPKHQRCASCHKPHRFAASVGACRTCHKNPTTGVHTDACTKCHQPHGPPLGKAASCQNCHKNIGPPGGKHSRCQTCHQAAHGPKVKAPLCGTCHKAKAEAVATWPKSAHPTCQNCHNKHNPTHPKACSRCHQKQARQVKPTRHTCNGCHDVHQPLPKNLWSTCNKCHPSQVRAVRGRGATHSVCGSCHKPHGFAKPSCTSCHKSLQGAHKIHAAKAKCTDCHATHARKTPTRNDCLRCHTNRANHFPNAQNCASCHLFAKH